MAEQGFLPQVIPDVPISLIGTDTPSTAVDTSSNQPTFSDGVFSPVVLPPKIIASPPVAREVLSVNLDTQRQQILGIFTFTLSGALQVGTYVNGVSGQLNISSTGITAKNLNGTTTFTLDGKTGNASFLGTIQAGTLIAGATQVGSSSVLIDGANGRIVVNDGTNDRILMGYQLNGF